jgi:uncharacterized protein YqgV (UPF0045/DUF77 family)
MVFELVFPREKVRNGFSTYVENLLPNSGLSLIEHCSSATVVEGDWEAAMSFLRQCQEYINEREIGSRSLTTVHIHS